MRQIRLILFISFTLLIVVSCDDFLGDNLNPNQAIAATPQLVLPNALTNTAEVVRLFNTAGSWISGYTVNAGGFGGWGSIVTYNYTTIDHQGLWSSVYDDLANYQYIEEQSANNEGLAYYNAIAKVMKAYDYQMLVDWFGDVPYTDALKGAENLTPTYTSAPVIYQDLINQLNTAIDIFQNTPLANPILPTADVMFGGEIESWLRFTNTLKLKLLIRISNVASLNTFVNNEFTSFDTSIGIITNDALVNPGYLPTDGKQNPMWATYHSNAAGAQSGAGRSAIPSIFVYTFYNGVKIQDNFRGPKVYRQFPTTPRGALGNLTSDQPFAITNFIAWYVGTGDGANATNAIGLFKGRTAGSPILLAAEGYFLLAEANLKGFISLGTDQMAFTNGVQASFNYIYKDINNTITGTPSADVASYFAANTGNKLADYSAALTNEEKLEAIITQKYIALNFIHGHEAWSEFRRTSYPKIVDGSSDPSLTFASILSTSTRSDRLPIRVLYAASEYQLNGANVPNNIDQFQDKIFWQQ